MSDEPTITVLSGETLEAGAVLGKVTASGKYKALDPAAVDGSEVAVRGWPEEPTDEAKASWIRDYSDHALLRFTVAGAG